MRYCLSSLPNLEVKTSNFALTKLTFQSHIKELSNPGRIPSSILYRKPRLSIILPQRLPRRSRFFHQQPMDLLTSRDEPRSEWLRSHILTLSVRKDIQLHFVPLYQR
jgi:hypothetical protein